MATINVADYQVDPAFPPDKERDFPPSEEGWMHAHNSLREELVLMTKALTAVTERGSLQEWEAEALGRWWTHHSEHLHSHHKNEDDLFSPFMRTRTKLPDKVEAEHKEIIGKMDELTSLIKGLKPGDDLESVSNLQKAWGSYREVLEAHLLEEEQVGIPLVRAYFTHKEVSAKTQEIIKKATRCELGSFFYWMGEDHCRNSFMPQEGIPFFVWYLEFKGHVAHYRKTVMADIEAVISGTEPQPETSSCVVM
mmetsp:Transcript_88201/g.122385  ORF Transcript_88201/g.122385 Transcript_88201/m.122385 type:complete len:251 (+) Transcript_88201:38-790(+)